jgi:hypothetical protein
MRISSRFLVLIVLLALGACAPGTEASDAVGSPEAPSEESVPTGV